MEAVKARKHSIVSSVKSFLYARWRLNRRPSNQLMMRWLKKALIENKDLSVAVDVGCGKAINRRFFKNDTYIGVDFKEDFIVRAKNTLTDDSFFVHDLANEVPPSGDLVVCTLVLNNKRYPVQKTVDGVKNLITAVRKEGSLVFTIGNSNTRYKTEIDKMLSENFKIITSKQYGKFNKNPTYLSYPISYLMYWFKQFRIDKDNEMYFYSCKKRK